MTYNKQSAFISLSVVLAIGLSSCAKDKSHTVTGDLVRIPTIIHEDGTKAVFPSRITELSQPNQQPPPKLVLHSHDQLEILPISGNASDLAEMSVTSYCDVNKGANDEKMISDTTTIPFSVNPYVFRLFSKQFWFNPAYPAVHTAECNFNFRVVANGGSSHSFSLEKTSLVFGRSRKPTVALAEEGDEPVRTSIEAMRIDYNHLGVNRMGFNDPSVTRGELVCENKIAIISPNEFGRPMDRLNFIDRPTITQKAEQYCRIFGYAGDEQLPRAMSDLILMNMAKPPLSVTEKRNETQPSGLYIGAPHRYFTIQNTSDKTVVAAIPTGTNLLQNIIAEGEMYDSTVRAWSISKLRSSIALQIVGNSQFKNDGFHIISLEPGQSLGIDLTFVFEGHCFDNKVAGYYWSLDTAEAPIYILRDSVQGPSLENTIMTMPLYKRDRRKISLTVYRSEHSNLAWFEPTPETYHSNFCYMR